MHIYVHVLVCVIKYSHIKFHENPSRGTRVVQCGWTDGQEGRQTDKINI